MKSACSRFREDITPGISMMVDSSIAIRSLRSRGWRRGREVDKLALDQIGNHAFDGPDLCRPLSDRGAAERTGFAVPQKYTTHCRLAIKKACNIVWFGWWIGIDIVSILDAGEPAHEAHVTCNMAARGKRERFIEKIQTDFACKGLLKVG